jgi:hypothetical protein
MASQARPLYTSSSGDTWSLRRDQKSDVVVFHQPNSASGGRASEIDLGAFLAKGNNGPEHQALRRLIGELIEAEQLQAEYDDHD